MIILHYTPSLRKSAGQTGQFAQVLRDAMGNATESHLISGKISRQEFIDRLVLVNPDIVHIHGCWDMHIALVQKWAINRGYPVILSPHNGMSQKNMQQDFWKKRVPQIVAYQFRTIKNSLVLHATSPQELKDLKELGWKKRIALIPYPTSPDDYQSLRDGFRALYQKVIDTSQRNRLNIREREALWSILHAAMTSRHELPQLSDTELQHINALTHHNWQAIQVYAIDHRIKDTLMEGIEALKLSIPVNITEPPTRYSIPPSFHTGKVTEKEKKVQKEFSGHQKELNLACDVYIFCRSILHNELRDERPAPFGMLIHIAEQIRWTDFDEDIFINIVNALGIQLFTARLMQILAETMRISIGYMPTDPIDDYKTETMRKRLNCLI